MISIIIIYFKLINEIKINLNIQMYNKTKLVNKLIINYVRKYNTNEDGNYYEKHGRVNRFRSY